MHRFIIPLAALATFCAAQIIPINASWHPYYFSSKGKFVSFAATYTPSSVSFTYPTTQALAVTKLVRQSKGTPLIGTQVYATVAITGNGAPQFVSVPVQGCTSQRLPDVRLFISNDTGKFADSTRWWSLEQSGAMTLGLTGGATLAGRLEPQYWSDGGGHRGSGNLNPDGTPNTAMDAEHTAAFWGAVNGSKEIGVTFGGPCNNNHGSWNVGSPVTFTLMSWGVQ